MPKRLAARFAVLAAALILVSPAGAASPVVEGWKGTLLRAEKDLRGGQFKRALQRVEAVSDAMIDQVAGGEGVDQLLALTATLRAVAEVGLGREREAAWDWQVALQLFPEVSRMDLAPYGEAGRFLASATPLEERPWPKQEVGAEPPDDVAPPRKRRHVQPQFPRGRVPAGEILTVIASCLIREDGKVAEPRILESNGEVLLVYSALVAMRDWKYEPVRYQGKAIKAWYNLQFNYRGSGYAGSGGVGGPAAELRRRRGY
jgi:hypothetical protein